jgi:GAF domain-containing protein
VTDQTALMRVLTDFARLLANDYAVSDALHDLVDGVTKVVGITGAGVSLVNGDRITFATAANEAVTVIERLQEGTQAGPCLDAHRSGQPVLVADVTDHSERWPALAQAAPAVGLVAVAGIPMQLSARREWSDDEVNMARLLADMATGSVANASRLDKVRHTTAQLQVALDSRIIIEQAKGVLAGETNISVDEAFRVLRHHARNNNASLHSVADAVVNLGLRP